MTEDSKPDRLDCSLAAFYESVREVYPSATDDEIADIVGALFNRRYMVRRIGFTGWAYVVWSAVRDVRRVRSQNHKEPQL